MRKKKLEEKARKRARKRNGEKGEGRSN